MINLVLVDDHNLLREGIKQLLEFNNDMKVVEEYDNGQDLIENIENLSADIILLDINMPGINGLDVLSYIRHNHIDVKVLLLTVHSEVEYIARANGLGVDGYILKDAGFEELRTAILSIYEGNTYIHPKLIPSLNNYLIRKDDDEDIISSLTNREIEVLKLLSTGGTNKDIAEILGISERTIKNHISNIFKKIGVNDRTQAAVFTIKNNLVSI